MKFFSPQLVFDRIISMIKRFPLESILVVCLSVLWFIEVNHDSWISESILAKGSMALLLTIFLSLGLSLYREYQNKSFPRLVGYILAIIFGVSYYSFTSFSSFWIEDFFVPSFLIFFFFFSFLFSLPYLSTLFSKNTETKEYYNYILSLTFSFATAIFVGITVFLLSLGALFASIGLFDLHIAEEYWIKNLAVIAVTLIGPIYFLIHLPLRSQIQKNSFHLATFTGFFFKFVMIPFMYLYLVILYVYTLKVLSNFHEWPKGIVSWLVIVFSIFGYISYVFALPYSETSSLVRIYRKIFPYLLFPQILMLFYAIALRIHQYDLSMNRYFVVVFGIWLLISTLYFLISREKKIIFFPLLLSTITLLISFGPWGALHFPLQRQESRLINNFQKAGMLSGNTIVPLKKPTDIDPILAKDIISGLNYACQYNSCKFLKDQFPGVIQEDKKYPYEMSDTVRVYLNLPSGNDDADSPYITLSQNTDHSYGNYPLDISGYDMITFVDGRYIEQNPGEYKYPYATFDPDEQKLRLFTSTGVVREYPLPLPVGLSQSSIYSKLDQKDLTFFAEDDFAKIEVVFQTLTLKNPLYHGVIGKDAYIGVTGVVLIKYKK